MRFFWLITNYSDQLINTTIFLIEFDSDFRGITTEDFLDQSKNFIKIKKPTLGKIFSQLKQNPKLILEDDLSKYLDTRNVLVHHLWKEKF